MNSSYQHIGTPGSSLFHSGSPLQLWATHLLVCFHTDNFSSGRDRLCWKAWLLLLHSLGRTAADCRSSGIPGTHLWWKRERHQEWANQSGWLNQKLPERPVLIPSFLCTLVLLALEMLPWASSDHWTDRKLNRTKNLCGSDDLSHLLWLHPLERMWDYCNDVSRTGILSWRNSFFLRNSFSTQWTDISGPVCHWFTNDSQKLFPAFSLPVVTVLCYFGQPLSTCACLPSLVKVLCTPWQTAAARALLSTEESYLYVKVVTPTSLLEGNIFLPPPWGKQRDLFKSYFLQGKAAAGKVSVCSLQGSLTSLRLPCSRTSNNCSNPEGWGKR